MNDGGQQRRKPLLLYLAQSPPPPPPPPSFLLLLLQPAGVPRGLGLAAHAQMLTKAGRVCKIVAAWFGDITEQVAPAVRSEGDSQREDRPQPVNCNFVHLCMVRRRRECCEG